MNFYYFFGLPKDPNGNSEAEKMNLDGLYITPRVHFRQENPQRVPKIPVINEPTWIFVHFDQFFWDFWGFLGTLMATLRQKKSLEWSLDNN